MGKFSSCFKDAVDKIYVNLNLFLRLKKCQFLLPAQVSAKGNGDEINVAANCSCKLWETNETETLANEAQTSSRLRQSQTFKNKDKCKSVRSARKHQNMRYK